MYNILIPDHIYNDINIEKRILGEDFNIRYYSDSAEIDVISQQELSKADGILAWDKYSYDSHLIDKLKSCKIIVRVGAGVDNFDLEYARSKAISICNTPAYGVDEVAEHTIALALSLSRRLPYFHYQILNEKWPRTAIGIQRLRGITFGIIGCGRIGSAVSQRAKALGFNVLIYDPFLEEGKDKYLMLNRVTSIKELLNQSDVVSLHVPLNEETYDLLNYTHLKEFKENSILVNTSRGEVVDPKLIIRGLLERKFLGVGLDVYKTEPIKNESDLYEILNHEDPDICTRLIVSSHSAYYSSQSSIEMREMASETLKAYLLKNLCFNCMN